MEMPTVGQRCALKKCKQLDFLPFTCAHCQGVFCKEHFAPGNHSCASAKDRVANVGKANPSVPHRCSFPLCLARSPLEMLCPACLAHFCLEHRHHGCMDQSQTERDKEQEKWDASRRQFEAAKAKADRQVNDRLSRAIARANTIAAQVQLIRLKSKAVGSRTLPVADRVHFLVHAPLGSGRPSKGIYVGRQWSVGRAVDEVAELCDVANRNNEPGQRKLRLFRRRDGAMLAGQMDRKLDELLSEESLVDGETLVLEYQVDGSSGCLEDVERYQE